MSFLTRLSDYLARLSNYLTVMGIPGLLIISFLDSACVPLPGGPDAVVVLLAGAQPSMFILIALTATLGSTLGNMVLYGIIRKGGEKALARFKPERIARMERIIQDYGIWGIMGSMVAPPPFPTKLVVLAAGVLRIGKLRFALSVFVGRLVRYMLVAWLAAEYGKHALEIIREHSLQAAVVLVAIIVLALALHFWRSRHHSAVV